jgi:lysophospholipase L1-like esterase
MTEGTTSPALPARRFALDPGLPRSYPFKLQTMITGRYTGQTISVFNAGRAGRRASEDLSRFNDALSEARPDAVMLLQGANDLNAPLESGEGINDRVRFAVGSLEEMVKSAVARGIPIYLGTLPPQRLGGPKAAPPEFLPRFNDALKVMAGLKGAIIVDVFPQFPLSDIGQDGLHPTDDGYQRLATIWFETLKARHETAPAPGPSAPAAHHTDAGELPGSVGLPATPQHD